MYMQFEKCGLIRGTEEYEKRMEEKKNESATDQSYRLNNNTCNAISIPIIACQKGDVNMTKKEWLDDRVDDLEKSREEYRYDEDLKMCRPVDQIHLSEGIVGLANKLGAELIHEYLEDCEYPHRYSFMYRGHEVLQLSNKEINYAISD